MFFILPPIVNLLFLFAPIIWFRIDDFAKFKSSEEEEYVALRTKHHSYWLYRSRAPRNPTFKVYGFQALWAAVSLIPFWGTA